MKNEIIYTSKKLRQRRFMLVLPLLVLPFITFLFWSLGGGRGDELNAQSKVSAAGLNLELPEAKLKNDNDLTKLSFYEQADNDSLKYKDLARNDPYWKSGLSSNDEHVSALSNQRTYHASTGIQNYKDPNEEKIYSKIEELNKQLNSAPQVVNSRKQEFGANKTFSHSPIESKDVDKLEGLMHSIQENRGDDQQMQQLNEVVQKIAELQGGQKDKAIGKKSDEQVSPGTYNLVSNARQDDTLANKSADNISEAAFYSSDNFSQSLAQTSIVAVVHETQTLVSGSVIKLRLMQDVYVKGQQILKGGFVFGLCELNNERLSIKIPSVAYDNNIYPVNLIAYDIDGLEGIYIPGNLTRDVAKQSADNALQSLELMSFDRSVKAQATGAGIGAIKSLLSKKVRQVKVTVKAGYQLLLKNQSE
jgi:conjugative transposon TraM protein